MIIDTHVHLGRIFRTIKELTPRKLIESMDHHGIDKAVAMTIANPEETDFYYPTEQLLKDLSESKEFSSRIIPFCCIDPRRGGNDRKYDFLSAIREYVNQGCRGFGEVLANLSADDQRMQQIYQACGELGIPAVLHIQMGNMGVYDEVGLPRLEKMLRDYPNTKFICHAQGFWSEISNDVTVELKNAYPTGNVVPGKLDDLFTKYPNLYGDLSANSGYNALNRDRAHASEFLGKHHKQLLFASDMPCVSYENPGLKSLITDLAIDGEVRENILGKKAERILKI